MKYCFKYDIILCRLPFHTSHKTQPLDVNVFGPLKTAYCELVGQRNHGGVDNVGKQYFALPYDWARKEAFALRNINSGLELALRLWALNDSRYCSHRGRLLGLILLRRLNTPLIRLLSLSIDNFYCLN
jgi:hypothetical protein